MNASQRRNFRRILSTATGIVPGLKLTRDKGAKVATVVQLAPGGSRNVLVRRGDNRRVLWPLADVQAVPA
jgi:hypothetical protein